MPSYPIERNGLLMKLEDVIFLWLPRHKRLVYGPGAITASSG